MSDEYVGQTQDAALGQDFLTWLWYASVASGGTFKAADGAAFALFMERRVAVQGGEGDNLERTVVSGRMAELKEAKTGLAMGKKVTSATLRIEQDAEAWQVTVKAEDLSLSAFRVPKTASPEDGDDPDAALLERLFLLEKPMGFLDGLFERFLDLRLSPGWEAERRKVARWLAAGA
jgi:hypothetical protein